LGFGWRRQTLCRGILKNCFTWNGKRYVAEIICDASHTETAESLADYEKNFYVGMPIHGVEVAKRRGDKRLVFYLNHNDKEVQISVAADFMSIVHKVMGCYIDYK